METMIAPEPGSSGLITRFTQWINCLLFGRCYVIM